MAAKRSLKLRIGNSGHLVPCLEDNRPVFFSSFIHIDGFVLLLQKLNVIVCTERSLDLATQVVSRCSWRFNIIIALQIDRKTRGHF